MVVVDVIVVLAFLVPILPLLTTAPELVLTIPKCLPAAFCRAHLTIRCIGSRLVLGCEATAPPAADENPDHPLALRARLVLKKSEVALSLPGSDEKRASPWVVMAGNRRAARPLFLQLRFFCSSPLCSSLQLLLAVLRLMRGRIVSCLARPALI